MDVIFVGIGGFFGAIARYIASKLLNEGWINSMPWGTLLVNAAGGFLMGLLMTLPGGRLLGDKGRLLLCTGFLGGLTTFSTFGMETITYMREGMPGKGLLNIILQLGSTLIAVLAGVVVANAVSRASAG